MKRCIPLALIGVALAVISASFVRRGCCDAQLAASASCGDTRCWFRREFGLDSATCDAIAAAQAGFKSDCERHCEDVAKTRANLAALPPDASEADRAAATTALKETDTRCREARVAHVRRIAAMMPPEAGKRYLDLVLPRLAVLDHSGSPDAAGNR